MSEKSELGYVGRVRKRLNTLGEGAVGLLCAGGFIYVAWLFAKAGYSWATAKVGSMEIGWVDFIPPIIVVAVWEAGKFVIGLGSDD